MPLEQRHSAVAAQRVLPLHRRRTCVACIAATPTLMRDLAPSAEGSVPTAPESAFTKLYFAAETPTLGRELWSVAIPTGLLGDMNCDGFVTVADIGGFVLSLTDPAAYAAQFETCDIRQADVNQDGFVTVADIGGFVALLTGG